MNQKLSDAGSTLVSSNNLTRRASGVFTIGETVPFAHSDGADSEQYLRQVLANASDLSSTSAELEAAIQDWPSEYHLSSKRANLLRGLHLAEGSKVLELGCGCGAITRYLGEQGLQVDAMEGSAVRAEIAALRCRDLAGVNIVCANFNEIDIPADTYDAVFLIGVAEYVARLWPGEITEEAAVVKLLRSARSSTRKNGIVVVAIENRTGMKYVLGAHEDHYSKRYVGVHNYPEQAGIKTYTRYEWSALIEQSGFDASAYQLPFPDYKVPTVLLSEDFALRHTGAYAHIEGVRSRDYLVLLDLAEHEPVFWESASANKTLPQFANSFLIVMGAAAAVEQSAPNDFVHLPDFNRKLCYCVINSKKAGSQTVERRRVSDTAPPAAALLTQHVKDEPYLDGNLLSVDWSRSLLIDPWASRFKRYLLDFYEYLGNNELHVDLVPTNIIVDAGGQYRHFDQEWAVTWDLDRDYVFFRAVMLFALRHRATLRVFSNWYSLYTIKDFILFCFRTLSSDTEHQLAYYDERHLVGYLYLEEEFQNQVNREDASGLVTKLLDSRINETGMTSPVRARLYWKQPGQAYSDENSILVHKFADREVVRLNFEIPVNVTGISHIRFDPSDEKSMRDIGFMKISSIRVEATGKNGGEEILHLQGCEQIAAHAKLSGIVFNKAKYGETFAAVGDNPEMEFELGCTAEGRQLTDYKVKIDCTHTMSAEYWLVRDRYMAQEEILKKKLERIGPEYEYLKHRYVHLKQELELMKASKAWRLAQRIRSALGRGGE